MKTKHLIIVSVVAIVALKILFSIVSFLFSRKVLLSLLGLGVAVKSGLISKISRYFKPKKMKNSDVVIEVETVRLD